MANSQEQMRFAMELLEFTGINLMDRINIEQSIAQHRTAEIHRAWERNRVKAETQAALESYFANGGIITHLPPGKAMGHLSGGGQNIFTRGGKRHAS